VFQPHLTLTSELARDAGEEVLAGIEVVPSPTVKFREAVVGETYFTRVTLHVEKDPALVGLAKQCREKFTDAEAERWAVETFTPHVSLVYAAMGKARVEGEGVLGKVLEEVGKGGVLVGGEGEAEMAGWRGGRIVLVHTWKDIAEWVPVAEREI